MSETGDFELFKGPQPSEKKEMSDEQFQEEMRKVMAAVQQIQKEEQKAKKNDNRLASIIVQFLNQPENTDLFILISRVVSLNIPSDMILAIIALVDEAAAQEVAGLLGSARIADRPDPTALAVQEKEHFDALPPEHKGTIDGWIQNIFTVAMVKPHFVLETLITKKEPHEIASSVIQFSTFILRRYLEKYRIEFDYDRLYEFMSEVYTEMVRQLSKLIQGQKHLKTA